eukprot:5082357-Pyramimonas_sp.AAC.1
MRGPPCIAPLLCEYVYKPDMQIKGTCIIKAPAPAETDSSEEELQEEVAQQAFLRQALRHLNGVAVDYRLAETAVRTRFQSVAGAKLKP